MSLPHSSVTAQGQISVPAEIRRKLGLGPGSILEWEEESDRITVRKAGRHSSEDIHQAIFPARPERRTLEEIKEAIRRRALAQQARR